ncbi:hypothetical protein H2204_001134 [Knufia peltigerae]|uniref:SPRY domain-containing protein n=1 Tax=Knufia peltigerae TaxID=1002370 RepID=A0AA38YDQ6_9EURO|nr:hypothetical protein H2204_001134 [Knufia peltigerae]
MGFFKSLKGKVDVGTDDTPTGSQYDAYSTAEEKRRVFGRSSSNDNYTTTTDEQYDPPSGPPPPQSRQSEFAPPPGPPPNFLKGTTAQQPRQDDEETYAPPSGPPPGNPPPYHDWTVIPDTALLPPPPPLPQDYSPTNNASYDSAARAHEWCARHPLYTPSPPSRDIHDLAASGHLTLERPPAQLCNKNFVLRQKTSTTWSVRTPSQQQDAVIMSSIPLYFAAVDNPLVAGHPKTVSFEIHVLKISNANSGIAVGYAAKPYPPWRLPGWHRASIGVHGDDGRRFVNDSWGGRDFVEPFRPGETVRVGMRFSATPADASGSLGKVKTTAFVARNGRTNKDWEWEIDEERDERDEGVDGLMGEGDLYPAIGVFGAVEFEVRFGVS